MHVKPTFHNRNCNIEDWLIKTNKSDKSESEIIKKYINCLIKNMSYQIPPDLPPPPHGGQGSVP